MGHSPPRSRSRGSARRYRRAALKSSRAECFGSARTASPPVGGCRCNPPRPLEPGAGRREVQRIVSPSPESMSGPPEPLPPGSQGPAHDAASGDHCTPEDGAHAAREGGFARDGDPAAGAVPTDAPKPGQAPESADVSRPIPVREGLTVEASAPSAKEDDETPERALSIGGEAWRVRIEGRGMAGRGVSPAALMLLRFYRGTEERPARETLVPGSTLSSLAPEQLGDAFSAARPVPVERAGGRRRRASRPSPGGRGR